LKRNQTITLFIGVSLFLLVASILYSLFRDQDPYNYFTGLGSELSISPDDEKLAFSYFLDGNEAIYTSKIDGTEVTKISKENEGRFHAPRFSFDGKQLLFLSENNEGIQSLMIMDADGSNSKRLTEENQHVSDAVFAPNGETVYYIAMPAEDVKKAEGETKEGLDLYTVEINGSGGKQLTDKDHFTMDDLSISNDGEELSYRLYDGNKEQIYSFSLIDNKEAKSEVAAGISGDMYSTTLSDDKKLLAYTTVSEESKNSSLFEYELYIKDMGKNETKRLTNFKTNIESPVFFHHSKKIAFLHYQNWPSNPEKYQVMTVSVDGEEPVLIDVNLPDSEEHQWFMKTVDFILSEASIAVYYVLLLGGITVYLRRISGRVFLPALISLSLAVLIFISSFIVATMTDPWFGIGLVMVAMTIFLCSILLLLFAFVVKRIVKPL
jgi:Tol biopolymer transport system component